MPSELEVPNRGNFRAHLTLQGEGVLAGHRTMFVRFGGCDGVSGLRDWCSWCDSMFAVDPQNKGEWKWETEEEIVQRLQDLAPWCKTVTLSGGNPALFELADLVEHLKSLHYQVAIETQGTVWKDWMAELGILTVSPKPPSAGAVAEAGIAQWRRWYDEALEQIDGRAVEYPPHICVKVAVSVEPRLLSADFRFAKEVMRYAKEMQPQWVPVSRYLSVVTDAGDTTVRVLAKWRVLAEVVAQDKEIGDVAVLAQLHVLLWGHERGV